MRVLREARLLGLESVIFTGGEPLIEPNLTTYVAEAEKLGIRSTVFTAGFLPAAHQGVVLKPNDPTPIANLRPPAAAKQVTAASEATKTHARAFVDKPCIASSPCCSFRRFCAASQHGSRSTGVKTGN